MAPGNLTRFAKEILEKRETVVTVVQDLLEDQETAQLRHLPEPETLQEVVEITEILGQEPLPNPQDPSVTTVTINDPKAITVDPQIITKGPGVTVTVTTTVTITVTIKGPAITDKEAITIAKDPQPKQPPPRGPKDPKPPVNRPDPWAVTAVTITITEKQLLKTNDQRLLAP